MAETITKKRRLAWTAEEDEVLLQCYREWLGPFGRARHGFYKHAATLLSHRGPTALRARLGELTKQGKRPHKSARSTYKSHYISPTDAAWLAGILDGEGCLTLRVHNINRRGKLGLYVDYHATLVSNTDLGIIEETLRILPWAHKRLLTRSKQSWLPCYEVRIFAHEAVRDVLTALLPYMHHSGKRDKAAKILQYINTKLGEMR